MAISVIGSAGSSLSSVLTQALQADAKLQKSGGDDKKHPAAKRPHGGHRNDGRYPVSQMPGKRGNDNRYPVLQTPGGPGNASVPGSALQTSASGAGVSVDVEG